MKRINYISLLVFTVLSMVSCHKDGSDADEYVPDPDRTVLIYACAENTLDSKEYPNSKTESNIYGDLTEIIEGKEGVKNNNLLVFVDRISTKEPPYILRVTPKGCEKVRTFDKDFYCTDPSNMKEIMQWVTKNYPAPSYGLCFWGHGTGSLEYKDSIASHAPRRKAYGWDTGQDAGFYTETWINIPTLAKVIAEAMPHLDYIFWDCCCMQSFEVAYELRNVCDYMIGSPAEIPDYGAPYKEVIPALFLPKEQVGHEIIDRYIANSNFGKSVSGLPMSVIKTSALDSLAHATSVALQSFTPLYPTEINRNNCIFYFRVKGTFYRYPIMYDLRDVMKKNLSVEDFSAWDKVLKLAVPYSVHPADYSETKVADWTTAWLYNDDFSYFRLGDDNYGGISMFFPASSYSYVNAQLSNLNKAYFHNALSQVIDWSEYGWEK